MGEMKKLTQIWNSPETWTVLPSLDKKATFFIPELKEVEMAIGGEKISKAIQHRLNHFDKV